MTFITNTKIAIEVEGTDVNGFDVTKRYTDILFGSSDRIMDADAIAFRTMRAITSLKRNSTVTVYIYRGERLKTLEAIRWTYEGYNGNEWMKRELVGDCFRVTENFVKNKDIKKDIIRMVDKMNLIQDLETM